MVPRTIHGTPGTRLRGRRRRGFSALLGCLAGFAAAPAAATSVEGQVSLGLEGTSLAQVAPVVVYLEPIEAPEPAPERPSVVRINQRNATFQPRFEVVSVGQTVEMPNLDAIYHNVFSYSRPNDFDLGIYPAGESRSVTFRHAGVVKTYCSIHETMNGTILVVPNAHHAIVHDSGRFTLKDVAPGRYTLVAWSEKLPTASREIRVGSGERVYVEIALGASGPHSDADATLLAAPDARPSVSAAR